MDHHTLTESYRIRSESYIAELKKDPSAELRVKFEMNLLASNLVLENLFSFYDALSKNLEVLQNKGLEIGSKLRVLTTENPPDVIKQKIEELNKSNITDKKERLEKILSPVRQVKELGQLNDSIQKIKNSLILCEEESEKSVYRVFAYNKKTELQNGLKVLFRFIANLNPFVSGADSIYQLVQSKQIRYSTADKCLRELNEYWNNCFSLAVSSKYLEKVLLNLAKSPLSISVNAKQCVDETYHKLTSIQAKMHEDVIEQIMETKI